MGTVYGYGCVSSGKYTLRNNGILSSGAMEIRKNTKIYAQVQQEVQKIHNLFFPEDSIRIDIIGGSQRKRKFFEFFLETMDCGDTILIASLSSLGLTNEELLFNFTRLYEHGIGLLLPDYSYENGLSPFSTTDFGFGPISISKSDFEKKCNQLKTIEIETNRGRKKTPISEEFIYVYWLYENYFIDAVTVYHNNRISLAKATFKSCCESYEASKEYDKALSEQDKLNGISEKPKRFGVIDYTFENVIKCVEEGLTVSEACKKCGYKNLSEINYKRYVLKYLGGKSATLKAAFKYKDESIIASLTKEE